MRARLLSIRASLNSGLPAVNSGQAALNSGNRGEGPLNSGRGALNSCRAALNAGGKAGWTVRVALEIPAGLLLIPGLLLSIRSLMLSIRAGALSIRSGLLPRLPGFTSTTSLDFVAEFNLHPHVTQPPLNPTNAFFEILSITKLNVILHYSYKCLLRCAIPTLNNLQAIPISTVRVYTILFIPSVTGDSLRNASK
jgi:hypothetical protein